jgi:protein subunit release factor B
MKSDNRAREQVLHLTRDDFQWEYFRVGGKGGQRRDKTDSGVRCTHNPSGAVGESREHRTQGSNRKTAFRRCAESREFQSWIRLEHAKRVGAIDAAVEQALRPENLTVEYGPFDD